MKSTNHKLWVERYRPTTVKDYIFKDVTFREFIYQCISDKTFPHLLFTGSPGTGKTTIANVLISECGVLPEDVLEANASDDNSIDYVRNVIKPFVTTSPLGEFKVVLLEEADRLTIDAQGALKVIMEEYADNARFIFTTNRDYKITPALKSRMQEFAFYSADTNDIAEYIAMILIAENIKFTIELVDDYISIGYPDIRKIVQLVAQNSKSGVLKPSKDTTSPDYTAQMLELIIQGRWTAIRDLLCGNMTNDEWESIYTFMYKNIHKCPKFAKEGVLWDDAIVIINDYLYKHSFVADPEICATAMFCQFNILQKG